MNNTNQPNQPGYSSIEMFDQETLSMLKEYAQSDPDVVKDIIDSFEPEASVLIQEIKEAVHNRNNLALKKSAHALAGICGSIGAKKLETICRDVDNRIKSGNAEESFPLTSEIFKAYDELIGSLNKILE